MQFRYTPGDSMFPYKPTNYILYVSMQKINMIWHYTYHWSPEEKVDNFWWLTCKPGRKETQKGLFEYKEIPSSQS